MLCQDKDYMNSIINSISTVFPINHAVCVLWEDKLMRLLLIWQGWYMPDLAIYKDAVIRFLFLICYHEFSYQNKTKTVMF